MLARTGFRIRSLRFDLTVSLGYKLVSSSCSSRTTDHEHHCHTEETMVKWNSPICLHWNTILRLNQGQAALCGTNRNENYQKGSRKNESSPTLCVWTPSSHVFSSMAQGQRPSVVFLWRPLCWVCVWRSVNQCEVMERKFPAAAAAAENFFWGGGFNRILSL